MDSEFNLETKPDLSAPPSSSSEMANVTEDGDEEGEPDPDPDDDLTNPSAEVDGQRQEDLSGTPDLKDHNETGENMGEKNKNKKPNDDYEDDDEDGIEFVSEVKTEDEDFNNTGRHTNDRFNIPDREGRVLVNVDHPPEDRDVFLHPRLVDVVQPHQIGGIRFLYETLIQDLSTTKSSAGSGCILAHSMGLGKTLQTISFIHIFLTETHFSHVLCIVPVNTIQNWKSEFRKWLPKPAKSQQQMSKLDTENKAASSAESKVDDDENPSASDSCQEGSSDAKAEFLIPDDDDSGGDGGGDRDEDLADQTGKELSISSDTKRDSQKEIKIFSISDKISERVTSIRSWHRTGGVLLIGYEMYRNLIDPTSRMNMSKAPGDGKAFEDIRRALVKPGPDLVVCDEGHRIKNVKGKLSQALKSIRTRRRLVLTGYPLQNNLLEYFCMVDFVHPKRLGTREDFRNHFQLPVEAGQGIEATADEKRLMRERSYVLTEKLKGIVQRRSHFVLREILPKKREHVLFCRMSPIQRQLMLAFLTHLQRAETCERHGAIVLFSVCYKIWNHPDVLYRCLKGNNMTHDDLDLAFTNSKEASCQRQGRPKSGAFSAPPSVAPSPRGYNNSPEDSNSGLGAPNSALAGEDGLFHPSFNPDLKLDYSWANPILAGYTPGNLETSPKMKILMEIIDHTIRLGDRILVFSQSLVTLNLIEELLQKKHVPQSDLSSSSKSSNSSEAKVSPLGFSSVKRPQNSSTGKGGREKFALNVNYFRIDGSTSIQDRESYINRFNSNEKHKVFLLSSRAGSLGINLVGANRIVLFDASWNPCHDAQAACRIYRYGQRKKCFIYRLICDHTLEKRIYDRQLSKQNIANRIVDELHAEAPVRREEISTLLAELDQSSAEENGGGGGGGGGPTLTSEELVKFQDSIMSHLCTQLATLLTKKPHEHESLFLDRVERKMTAEERSAAFRRYSLATQFQSNFTNSGVRSFYGSNYYPDPPMGGGGGGASSASHRYIPSIPSNRAGTFPSHLPDFSHDRFAKADPEKLANDKSFCSIDMLMAMSRNPGYVVKELVVDKNFSFTRYENGLPETITLIAGQKVHLIRTQAAIYIRPVNCRIIVLSREETEMTGLIAKFNLQYPPQRRPSPVRSLEPSTSSGGGSGSGMISNGSSSVFMPSTSKGFPIPVPVPAPHRNYTPNIIARLQQAAQDQKRLKATSSADPEVVNLIDSDEETEVPKDADHDHDEDCESLSSDHISNGRGQQHQKRKQHAVDDDDEVLLLSDDDGHHEEYENGRVVGVQKRLKGSTSAPQSQSLTARTKEGKEFISLDDDEDDYNDDDIHPNPNDLTDPNQKVSSREDPIPSPRRTSSDVNLAIDTDNGGQQQLDGIRDGEEEEEVEGEEGEEEEEEQHPNYGSIDFSVLLD